MAQHEYLPVWLNITNYITKSNHARLWRLERFPQNMTFHCLPLGDRSHGKNTGNGVG